MLSGAQWRGPYVGSVHCRDRQHTRARQKTQEEIDMGDRIDEIKGKAKESIGDLTGNEQLKRQGQADAATAKARRETEGAIDKAVGSAQETWADLTGDEQAEAEAEARQAEGDLKRVG